MSGPWEQFAASPTGTPAPWEAYGSKKETSPSVNQEMHPQFGVGERLLLKNFANSPDAMVKYLQKKHPDMDIKIYDGQVIGKLPDESEYRALDPNPNVISEPGKFLKDLPLDTADLGTDVAQGVGSGIASAAGGIAGGLATGGMGAIPAAMATGGATNASLEALKQKLGQYFGIPQEVSGRDVMLAGAAGAASPLLFGTGASAANLAKGAAQKGLTSAELGTVTSAQRGMVPRALDYTKNKVLPGIGEYTSGVPSEIIKERAKSPAALQNLQENGLTDYVEGVHDNLRQGIASAKNKIGQELEQSIDEAGKTVDLSKTKAIIDNHIKNLENSELKDNPLIQKHLAELKSARNDLFTEIKPQVTEEPVFSSILNSSGKPTQIGTRPVVTQTKTEMSSNASAKKAFELQELLKDQAELSKLGQGTQSRFGQGATAGDKAWAEASRKAYNEVNNELESATEGMSSQLKSQYREYAQLQRDLQSRFKNPEMTKKTLENIYGSDKQMLRERLQKVAELTEGKVNPLEDAKPLAVYKYFNEPKKVPLSAGGTTSTSRSLALGGIGAAIGHKVGGSYGAPFGFAAGNYIGSPSAIQHYINIGKGVGNYVQPAINSLPNVAYPAMPLSAWEMMQNQQGENQ